MLALELAQALEYPREYSRELSSTRLSTRSSTRASTRVFACTHMGTPPSRCPAKVLRTAARQAALAPRAAYSFGTHRWCSAGTSPVLLQHPTGVLWEYRGTRPGYCEYCCGQAAALAVLVPVHGRPERRRAPAGGSVRTALRRVLGYSPVWTGCTRCQVLPGTHQYGRTASASVRLTSPQLRPKVESCSLCACIP